jgi:hypothetical protein
VVDARAEAAVVPRVEVADAEALAHRRDVERGGVVDHRDGERQHRAE